MWDDFFFMIFLIFNTVDLSLFVVFFLFFLLLFDPFCSIHALGETSDTVLGEWLNAGFTVVVPTEVKCAALYATAFDTRSLSGTVPGREPRPPCPLLDRPGGGRGSLEVPFPPSPTPPHPTPLYQSP